MHDVFGNSIAVASFAEPAAELRIESDLLLETYSSERPPFEIAPDALRYPFIYSADDRIDLGRMMERQYLDPNDRLGSWARNFVRSNPTDTSALLADLNNGVAAQISYQSRESRRHADAHRDADPRLGFLPRLGRPLHRSGAQPRFRRPHRDRLSLSRFRRHRFAGRDRRRRDARLGRYLRAGRRLDFLRPHQPHHRRP